MSKRPVFENTPFSNGTGGKIILIVSLKFSVPVCICQKETKRKCPAFVSKLSFTSLLGVSLVRHLVPCESVTDLNAHTPTIMQVQHVQNRRTSVRMLKNLGRTWQKLTITPKPDLGLLNHDATKTYRERRYSSTHSWSPHYTK